MSDKDTICAVATSQGGAIGIVRVSGPSSITITDTLFSGKLPLSAGKSHTLHFGNFLSPEGTIIDEVLVSLFRAPHSYTGEDSVEISCHGSAYILQEVCRQLIAAGCRAARPGEFTQRAFLNGRLDLAQAEAVADVIAANNAATHRIAMAQMRGTYSHALTTIRDRLLQLTALLELELDFSDHEDLEFADRSELSSQAHLLISSIDSLTSSFAVGNAIKNGIAVAIIGAPNVGKSTLLNAIVHDDRAIVSDIQGTTRDTIDATFTIGDHTFRFIDTAGIRQTDDVIEQMGIERSLKAAHHAQMVILLSDGQSPFPQYEGEEHQSLLYVQTKSDLLPPIAALSSNALPASPDAGSIITLSAQTGDGMHLLEQRLKAIADARFSTASSDTIVTNLRHYDALLQAKSALLRVAEGLQAGISGDFIAQDLRECLHHLSEILGGAITSDEVISTIFSRFCIGK